MLFPHTIIAQVIGMKGFVKTDGYPIERAHVTIVESNQHLLTDSLGFFAFTSLNTVHKGQFHLVISHIGYEKLKTVVNVPLTTKDTLQFNLVPFVETMQEVVITGTMKEVSKLASPVPIDVYSAKFFTANPTCSVFDALQNINGVRPQLNCNICNTGDIHINGLEGPYTMVLIDGMPIVSGLSSVYGLSGIPQSLIDRVEIIKGPASTLYGSEAVGGVINIITKKASHAPKFSIDVFQTSWDELNADLSFKKGINNKVLSYFGLNVFNYTYPIDNNKDNFTDVTLQKRVSIFNKWDFLRAQNRIFTMAARYINEDRWGGEMQWNKIFRGSDQVYAENILTNRFEWIMNYQLPTKEKIFFRSSLSSHHQNSYYGKLFFLADQKIGFNQLTWEKTIGKQDWLTGASFRYTYYDDNTVVTEDINKRNKASITNLPGMFVQDEIMINPNNVLLLGMRYDYHSIHGNIFSPRINYKWNTDDNQNILRIGIGNGFRVANIFTEDHAALTGAREVVLVNSLKPEQSWNAQINFQKKWYLKEDQFWGFDLTTFYTRFSNKIIPDYETDPNKIFYNNLNGYAVSRGVTLNLEGQMKPSLKLIMGCTYLDVFSKENGMITPQLFTEHFTSTWSLSYTWSKLGLVFDYTGNAYSPMKLPLLGPLDPRKAYSPWWSIQNIQISKKWNYTFELYGGIKNILNWTPNQGNPFIIARANDPFDKMVQFNGLGQVIATPDNPYALTFDPSYVFGPNQGIRFFLGFRYNIL